MLNEKLRELRLSKNMTQEQAAQRLGVSSQTVSKWERGLLSPDISLLPKIAELYDCTIDSLFGMKNIFTMKHHREMGKKLKEFADRPDWENEYHFWLEQIEQFPDMYSYYIILMARVLDNRAFEDDVISQLLLLTDYAEVHCKDSDLLDSIRFNMVEILGRSGDKRCTDKLRVANSKSAAETVPNSLTFDENGRIYVLTGANSGGKSVFLESVAMAQLMFQLGLPVLAREAKMFAFNNIHLYLASESFETNTLYGRFENEAKWFSERINNCGERDLFIMDELFSGTGALEAAEIAFSALSMIKSKGGNALFSTHLHGLAKSIAEMKDKDIFDNLSVDTQHPYSITRGTPQSYESKALTIAEKYGIV